MQGEAMGAVHKVIHKYSKKFKQYGKQTRETNINSNCRKCGKMRHNRRKLHSNPNATPAIGGEFAGTGEQ